MSLKINVRWPFLVIWAAWLAALYGGCAVYALASVKSQSTEAAGVWLIWTAVLFLPIEISGAIVNHRKRVEPEVARTFSQFMQIAAHRKMAVWWRGWGAMVTANAVLVSFMAGFAFWHIHWSLGIAIGVLVFTWNLFHWLERGRYG